MTIRQAITQAIDAQHITPFAVWCRVDNLRETSNIKEVSMNHLVDYLAGRADMTGERLDSVLFVLGLTIKPE